MVWRNHGEIPGNWPNHATRRLERLYTQGRRGRRGTIGDHLQGYNVVLSHGHSDPGCADRLPGN